MSSAWSERYARPGSSSRGSRPARWGPTPAERRPPDDSQGCSGSEWRRVLMAHLRAVSKQTSAPGVDADRAAEVLKALGHPLRLRIFLMVRERGEACPSELTEPLGQTLINVASHFRVLRRAGVLRLAGTDKSAEARSTGIALRPSPGLCPWSTSWRPTTSRRAQARSDGRNLKWRKTYVSNADKQPSLERCSPAPRRSSP